MNLLVTIRVALQALRKNKLRAGLTVLGVVIGIAAVTTMVSIGQSASQLVQDQFRQLGTNFIVIFPAAQHNQGVRQGNLATLTEGDAHAIAEECPAVLAATPVVFANGQIIYGNANWQPRDMWGVGEDYLTVGNWQMRYGGFFTEQDVHSADTVCIIGYTLVGKLFQTTNPLGKMIRIKNVPFRVIGVLEPKGANLVGEDQDNVVLMPYTTVRKRLQGSSFDDVNIIIASARSSKLMAAATQEIELLLYERHRIPPGEAPDFDVTNTTEIANVLGIVTGTLTLLLSSIAGISLIVGGVGIMNIMLVSVTERTREIGIRMAVGARSGDILRQFLVESVLLSCIGGVVGIILGTSASIAVTMLINRISSGTDWPIVVSLPAAIVAICFAAAVGIFFGYYPARRASRLDPIEALRYE